MFEPESSWCFVTCLPLTSFVSFAKRLLVVRSGFFEVAVNTGSGSPKIFGTGGKLLGA